MRALVFDLFGGPEVLHIAERPDPVAGVDEAIVSTHAIGLNFADVYRRQGHYHLSGDPPWIAGYEAAGIIESALRSRVSLPVTGSRSPMRRSRMPRWWRCRSIA